MLYKFSVKSIDINQNFEKISENLKMVIAQKYDEKEK
tara:strand:- start:370 stop:480 length:111 start_codon:yes stop_codon:yes gene_type:complete